MAKGKLILICQSGGEFVTNDDGTMSYNGGEANAANVTSETPFNDLKLTLAETCNLDQKTVTIKYFLPGNKKNLITLKNDKDVKRMIDFHGDALTAEVFVTGAAGFDRSALEMQVNRESVTKKDETVDQDDVRTKKDETVKRSNLRAKKDGKVPTSPPQQSPAKMTRRAAAAAKAAATTQSSSDEKSEDPTDDAKSDGSSGETTSSASSDRVIENADSDSGSDYVPSRSANRKKRNSQVEIDVNASPADTVKKRRRTPSWKFGANGRPTIVSVPANDSVGPKSRGKSGKAIAENSGGRQSQRKSGRLASKEDSSREKKSGRKRGRSRSIVPAADDSDQDIDMFPGNEDYFEEPVALAVCDDDASPETLVAAWKSAITGVGQEFKSVHEFRDALQKYAIANRFVYKFKKNDTSRAIGGCAAEGCSWKFYAVWVPASQSFRIKTLNNVHTCDKESRKSAHPTKNWLVSTIKERLRESPHLKPKEIANGLVRDFGVELNYTQVWRGIGDAREQLHGSAKESYNKLPWFAGKIIETNPGSIVKLVIGDEKRFKALFVSFYASLCGFQNSCRPLLFLEATSLKSKYGEVLLTANAIDGNDGFLPVAFAIIDVEDDDNWHWFLEQLKFAILNSQPITFVFDREKNLKKSVLEIFEDAHIGYSIYHLLESFKRHVKGPFHGDGKAFLPVHFLAAAHAVRLVGFKKSTEQIKLISSPAYDWVMQIEPEHWATSSFKGERYNYITEDVGESYTKLMEDYRELPILHKIDALIRMMIDAMGDAKLDATMWSTQLTASKEKELEEENVKARGLKVLISSDTLFEVREDSTHVVNISTWSCTCLGWKETGLPCRHALAVFALTGRSPYDFCSKYFTVDAYRLTYAESINPVPIDGPPRLLLEKEEGEKQEEAEKDEDKRDSEMEDASKETGEKEEAEKEGGCKEDTEMEEIKKDESEKMDVEKEESTKAEAEENEVGKVDLEKEEGNKEDIGEESGEKAEVEKAQGEREEAEKTDGEKAEVEKAQGEREEAEKTDGEKAEAEKTDGEKAEAEEAEGEKAEKAEGEKEEAQKAEVENEEMEKDEEGDKEEPDKEEDKKEKVRKEHEDPNVLVLPPIPTRPPPQEKKEKVEWVDTEGEMKRTVTCTLCKQPGHNKKSCKTIM